MMKRLFLIIYVIAAALPLSASEPWSVERCMQYAADHSHGVRQQQFALEDSRAVKTQAIGAFLPSVYGSVDGQINFGRAIDPSTNTYTDVSTLYNGYGLQASLVVFDGLQRYNNLRLAKANEAMGRSGVRAEKDDVAQMRATLAADEYELAHMQSQTTKAMLALKQLMGFPVDSTLAVIQPSFDDEHLTAEDASQISAFAATDNPRILKAQQNVEAARYSLRAARGALLPTISLSGGVSTSFFRNMDKGGHASFSSQFRNNAGEYVGLSLSIPLFDRLASYSTIRRRKTALVQAQENLAYEQSELRRIIVEAASDVENSTKEVEKMQEQVEADSIASRLTTRKYEEGLASSTDVKTAAVTLLQSRVRLLQSQLTMAYNKKLLAYYKGEKLWTDL